MSSKQKKVIIAMSGGIDSSVAAALLKKQGFDVIGVFMKFWSETAEKNLQKGEYNPLSSLNRGEYQSNRCCSLEAETRARAVANYLKIPFYLFNFEKEFKKRVVDYFVKEYKEGRTPNPCVVCNKQIKFGLLLKKALVLGADFVATGHYVRLRNMKKYETMKKISYIHKKFIFRNLLRAKDKTKDQSYFLWQLSQDQLKHILFPLGDYTKTQVRNLAKKFNLPVLNVPESQEVCFISTNLNDFLGSRIKTKKGDIIDIQGKKIGLHQGLPFYTIGQRRGIKLPGGPFYVVKKDFKNNNLIVAPSFDNKNLYSKILIAKDVNWISDSLCHCEGVCRSLGEGRQFRGRTLERPTKIDIPYKFPLKIKAQIRYGHEAVPAIITPDRRSLRSRTIFLRTTPFDKGVGSYRSNAPIAVPHLSKKGVVGKCFPKHFPIREHKTEKMEQKNKKTKKQTATYKLIFNTPQRAITPGQSVVFYSLNNQELLGGGIIKTQD